eukprot:6196312-Pleurochrysis_carterae.AAC.1
MIFCVNKRVSSFPAARPSTLTNERVSTKVQNSHTHARANSSALSNEKQLERERAHKGTGRSAHGVSSIYPCLYKFAVMSKANHSMRPLATLLDLSPSSSASASANLPRSTPIPFLLGVP